jgi:translocation and assembly module TamB
VKLNALINGSDRLVLELDAEPDGDRFALEVEARSAPGGVLPAMLGSKRSLDLVVTGEGTWSRWRGTAALDLSGRRRPGSAFPPTTAGSDLAEPWLRPNS